MSSTFEIEHIRTLEDVTDVNIFFPSTTIKIPEYYHRQRAGDFSI